MVCLVDINGADKEKGITASHLSQLVESESGTKNDILCHRIDEEHKISPSLGPAVIRKVSRNTS